VVHQIGKALWDLLPRQGSEAFRCLCVRRSFCRILARFNEKQSGGMEWWSSDSWGKFLENLESVGGLVENKFDKKDESAQEILNRRFNCLLVAVARVSQLGKSKRFHVTAALAEEKADLPIQNLSFRLNELHDLPQTSSLRCNQ